MVRLSILPQLATAEDDFGCLEWRNRDRVFAFDEDLLYLQGLVTDNQIDMGGIPRDDLHLKAGLVVADVQALQDVLTGRYIGEEEVPLGVAHPRPFEPLDDDGSPTNGLTAFGVDHVTGERTSLVAPSGIDC